MSQQNWILYIAHDKVDRSRFCPGSRQAVQLIREANLDAEILIQNVEVLKRRAKSLPTWLTGTPSLVDSNESLVFRGTQALSRLRELCVDLVEADAARKGDADANGPDQERESGDDDPWGSMDAGRGGRSILGQKQNEDVDAVFQSDSVNEDSGSVRQGNVTEADLQAYIAAREQSIPGGPLPQQ